MHLYETTKVCVRLLHRVVIRKRSLISFHLLSIFVILKNANLLIFLCFINSIKKKYIYNAQKNQNNFAKNKNLVLIH